MLVDVYQKSWALRYLREAIDEIKIAKKDNKAFGLILDALRKVEVAVYHSLGEPSLVENIVDEAVEKGYAPDNPVLRCLVRMKRSIRILEDAFDEHSDDILLSEVDNIVSMASKIIEIVTSLCAED